MDGLDAVSGCDESHGGRGGNVGDGEEDVRNDEKDDEDDGVEMESLMYVRVLVPQHPELNHPMLTKIKTSPADSPRSVEICIGRVMNQPNWIRGRRFSCRTCLSLPPKLTPPPLPAFGNLTELLFGHVSSS